MFGVYTLGTLALITDEIARWRGSWLSLTVGFDSFSLPRLYSYSHQIGNILLPNKNRIPKMVGHPKHQITLSSPGWLLGNAVQQSTFQIRGTPAWLEAFAGPRGPQQK